MLTLGGKRMNKKTVFEIVMTYVVGYVADYLIHKELDERTFYEIEKYLTYKYSDDVIELVYTNNFKLFNQRLKVAIDEYEKMR